MAKSIPKNYIASAAHPGGLAWQDIRLSDKDRLEPFLRNPPYEVEFLSFLSLYIWRFSLGLKYALQNGFLYIKATKHTDGVTYYFPLGSGDMNSALSCLYQDARENGVPLRFELISGPMKQILVSTGWDFEYNEAMESADYIYDIEALLRLDSKKIHKKKKMIERFTSENQFSYHTIDAVNAGKVREFLENYLSAVRDEGRKASPDKIYELAGNIEIMAHYKELGFIGGYLEVAGNIVSFMAGVPLSETMIGLTITKGLRQYHGATAAAMYYFLKEECANYRYANGGDDLGIPGLRLSKELFDPIAKRPRYKAVMTAKAINRIETTLQPS